MRAGRNTFIIALLVLAGGLLTGSRDLVNGATRQVHPGDISLHVTPKHLHFISALAQDQPADHSRHGEKRHGKSLISEAIVADCPLVVRPGFVYCHRNYALFLPGGCIRLRFGNFSLRGPPALC